MKLRHNAGRHNRYKARHHVHSLQDEIEAAWAHIAALRKALAKVSDSVRFIEGRLSRIDNRVQSEVRRYGR